MSAVPQWRAPLCYAEMDCDCCGASRARMCMERPHEGAHAYVCRACGADQDCG